jgi:hypothetical protein
MLYLFERGTFGLEQRAKVDNHQHERDGAIAVRSATINPSIARKALLNLVRANPGAFPSPLRVLTLEAHLQQCDLLNN